METIVLKDYEGNKKKFDIENFDEIKSIIIFIVCGDEVALVIDNNDNAIAYDSNDDRQLDLLDYLYILPKDKIKTFNRLAGSAEERMNKIIK